jgi:M6 family metalloprotease-like protein
LQATGFNFDEFDTDNDGRIDAIGFLHSGYAADAGDADENGVEPKDRIWSHKWTLFSLPGGNWTSTSGKSVFDYHISSALWGISGSDIGRIGVIAHETGHSFGLPNLYDEDDSSSGLGNYCSVANSWGFDGTQYNPPHMSAWAKVQLGWVTPKVISTSGLYSASKSCEFKDIYLIGNGTANFDIGEYLLIENCQRCKFDKDIPGPGLAIFHIDDSVEDDNNNKEGYPNDPNQTDWPSNGNHYRVALLQADGEYHLEKGTKDEEGVPNEGDLNDLFSSPNATGISNSGLSTGQRYPNTKSYKGGIIRDTGVTISNISVSGDTMTFNVYFNDFATASPSIAPTTTRPTTTMPTPTMPTTTMPTTTRPATTRRPTTMPLTTRRPTTMSQSIMLCNQFQICSTR